MAMNTIYTIPWKLIDLKKKNPSFTSTMYERLYMQRYYLFIRSVFWVLCNLYNANQSIANGFVVLYFPFGFQMKANQNTNRVSSEYRAHVQLHWYQCIILNTVFIHITGEDGRRTAAVFLCIWHMKWNCYREQSF